MEEKKKVELYQEKTFTFLPKMYSEDKLSLSFSQEKAWRKFFSGELEKEDTTLLQLLLLLHAYTYSLNRKMRRYTRILLHKHTHIQTLYFHLEES